MPLDTNILAGFTGSENFTPYSPLFRGIYLTDGAMYVAQHSGVSGAFWLMDAIASYQPQLAKHPDERLHDLQFWVLKVDAETKRAVLECWADSSDPAPAVVQNIEYTDFDLPEIKLWVGVGMTPATKHIFLPTEY